MPSLFSKRKQPSSKTNITANDQPVNSTGRTSLKWKITLFAALLFPTLLETLDYTIVATAQVQIASFFRRLDLQSYIGSCYLLTSTVFLPVFASLADIFDRHWALQIGLVFFLVGSAISTGAQNMAMMLAGRSIAGIGAAGLLMVVRVIMADSASLDENNWQTTIMWLLYGIGFSIGPPIGGALITISFRWIFAINLPCIVLAMIICFVLLRKRTKGGQPPKRLLSTSEGVEQTVIEKILRVDWVGAALFVSGGILILLALNWGPSSGWKTAKFIASFVVGALLFAACFLWQYHLERQQESSKPSKHWVLNVDPLVPLEILRLYDVCVVVIASFVNGMVMLVMFYFVAVFMTIVSGLSASRAGVQLLYFIPGMGGGSLFSIFMVKRLRQPRYPIILGGILFCVSLGMTSMAIEQNHQSQVNGFMAMSGVAIGLSLGSLPLQARFSLPADKVAILTALLLFCRSFGGTVGLAQCGAVMSAKVREYIISMADAGKISASEAAQLIALGTTSVSNMDSLPSNVQVIFRDAFRSGTRWCFISLVPWAGVSCLMTLFLKKIEDPDKVPRADDLELTQVENKDTGNGGITEEGRSEVRLEEKK